MKLAIGGDVCIMSDCCEAFSRGDGSASFNDVRSVLESADFSLINLECAITESEKPIKEKLRKK